MFVSSQEPRPSQRNRSVVLFGALCPCAVSLFKAACQTEVRKVGLMNRRLIYYHLVTVIIFDSLGFYGLLCFLCMMTSRTEMKLQCVSRLFFFWGGAKDQVGKNKITHKMALILSPLEFFNFTTTQNVPLP